MTTKNEEYVPKDENGNPLSKETLMENDAHNMRIFKLLRTENNPYSNVWGAGICGMKPPSPEAHKKHTKALEASRKEEEKRNRILFHGHTKKELERRDNKKEMMDMILKEQAELIEAYNEFEMYLHEHYLDGVKNKEYTFFIGKECNVALYKSTKQFMGTFDKETKKFLTRNDKLDIKLKINKEDKTIEITSIGFNFTGLTETENRHSIRYMQSKDVYMKDTKTAVVPLDWKEHHILSLLNPLPAHAVKSELEDNKKDFLTSVKDDIEKKEWEQEKRDAYNIVKGKFGKSSKSVFKGCKHCYSEYCVPEDKYFTGQGWLDAGYENHYFYELYKRKACPKCHGTGGFAFIYNDNFITKRKGFKYWKVPCGHIDYINAKDVHDLIEEEVPEQISERAFNWMYKKQLKGWEGED